MHSSLTADTVLQWEAARRAALLAGDAEALALLLSGQLVYVHSTAVRDTRASYLAKLSGGVLRYLRLDFTELVVQLHAGAALVTGRMSATVLKDGQEKQVSSLFLTVWCPEPGPAGEEVWRLCAHQGTPAPL